MNGPIGCWRRNLQPAERLARKTRPEKPLCVGHLAPQGAGFLVGHAAIVVGKRGGVVNATAFLGEPLLLDDPLPALRADLSRKAGEVYCGALMEDKVHVLIIGSGASGAAVAWSLAETRMKILCLEQGDWMKQSIVQWTRL